MQIPGHVRTLDAELREIFGSRLQAFVAYGIQGAEAAHDHGAAPHGHTSPATHTMAVVDTLTSDDLRACAARITGWHDAGLATPLLLAAHEFEDSLDAFPLEFGAIVADHVVVSGSDPFGAGTLDPADVRRACEVQVRSHLLHLREGYVETRGRADALAVLIVRSAGPFAALLKSIARLEGLATHDVAAAGRHAERTIGVTTGIVTEVAALATVSEIPSEAAERIFPPYLDAVQRLVGYVDGWSAR